MQPRWGWRFVESVFQGALTSFAPLGFVVKPLRGFAGGILASAMMLSSESTYPNSVGDSSAFGPIVNIVKFFAG